nr:MAG TPA: hypothetical protein [Caudoviricetes sp.]
MLFYSYLHLFSFCNFLSYSYIITNKITCQVIF